MRRICNSRLLAFAVLFGLSSAAWAEIIIRAGPVTVRVGQGVGVEVRPRAMPARAAEAGPDVQPPEGVPLEIVPPAQPVPLPGSKAVRPPTIQEFTAGFKPTPGTHEAVILHPYSNCPVKVSFCLPDGCPKVRVKGSLRRAIEFNYIGKDVQIWFYRDGRVKVNN